MEDPVKAKTQVGQLDCLAYLWWRPCRATRELEIEMGLLLDNNWNIFGLNEAHSDPYIVCSPSLPSQKDE